MDKVTLQKVFLVGIAVLFAGCAVLTVDVDVYKGPLANHEDIQTEQMAAMAIGAKPLLVELRDTLEARGPRGTSAEDASDFRETAKAEGWYKPAYIGPAPGKTTSRFRNQNADRVNEILSLYENRGDEQYSMLVDRADRALRDYETAYQILRPDSHDAEVKLWRKLGLNKSVLGLKTRSFKDEAKRLLSTENPNAIWKLSEDTEKLRNAYKNFFAGPQRDARALFTNWIKIRGHLEGSRTKLPQLTALQDELLLNKEYDEELKASSNAAFRTLAETGLVDFQAVHLFGLEGKKKDIFVGHVMRISRAFLDARDALERLWRVEMEVIIWLSDQPQEAVPRRDLRISETARASLDVIQSRHVVALSGLADQKDLDLAGEFVQLANEVGGTAKWYQKWQRADYELAKRRLLDRFVRQPRETAVNLLEWHKYCTEKLSSATLTNKQTELRGKASDHIWHVSGWRFGFTRGPFERLLDPVAMAKLIERVFPPGLFGKGRLDDGIETLIEKYLGLAEVRNPDDDALRRARTRLSDELVRFAEKVLFIANHHSLMSPPRELGLLPSMHDATVRGIFGQRVQKKWSKKFDFTMPDTETERYTRVLQAVGNSILVQVDALRQKEVHQSRSTDRLDAEIYAANRTLSQPPSRVIERLLEALRASISSKIKEIEKVEQDLEAAEKQQNLAVAYWLLVSEPAEDDALKAAYEAANAVNVSLRSPRNYASELVKELGKPKEGEAPKVRELLGKASEFLGDNLNELPQSDCADATKAREKVIGIVKEHYLSAEAGIELADEAGKAREIIDSLQKIVDGANKAANDASDIKTEIEHAIDAIGDAKYEVLRRADKAAPNLSPKFVRELLRLTLEEKLSEEQAKSTDSEKLQHALCVLRQHPMPIDPVGIDRSMLPDRPTIKDVRDVWITLLEYEHDLALRDGDEARANEIMEAIKAAREKRESMIFIRPAMAYLRTSFPATSLQNNPNLTWDNMLGGHMMRSIPFAPQIGEFLNPDAKRDARINAEIDKQFWQNINRVRVAGGGRTNYAVVKDDIGNWYVKGYSSNPEDIIQSAKNLALFSAGGKMGTHSLVPSTPADEPDRAPETPGSALESILGKHKDDYRRKTQQDYDLLYAIMHNSDSNIRDQIKYLWNANEEAKKKQTELETALTWSYTHFLEPFAPEVEENQKDIGKQRERIIEGIKRLKQFRNDLTWKITNVYKRDGELTGSNTAGQTAAKDIVKNVVEGQISALLTNRKDAIKAYENALMFLAEATQAQGK